MPIKICFSLLQSYCLENLAHFKIEGSSLLSPCLFNLFFDGSFGIYVFLLLFLLLFFLGFVWEGKFMFCFQF